jgi:hypothetical protein
MSHIARSSVDSVVSMRHGINTPANSTPSGFDESATRRSTTSVAPFRPRRSTRSMALASESVVIPRQPGTRINVHPGVARPHP